MAKQKRARAFSAGDGVELEVFKNFFHSIAEEMGAALRRTAFSPNIKERRDYSCAVFDSAGEVIAMGDHMPVHLGSMPMSVRAAITSLDLAPGDVAMLNDPFCGGTHLPDITLVAPVFLPGRSPKRRPKAQARRSDLPGAGAASRGADTPAFYVAARAHHADVGGAFAGSMGLCREIYQEGVRIPPVRLVRGGQVQQDVLALLLGNVRTPQEREGDLRAQLAACHIGQARLKELTARYGLPRVRAAAASLLDYSERMMRAFLRRVPPGIYRAGDFLDDDGLGSGPLEICVAIRFRRPRRNSHAKARASRGAMVSVDFSGTHAQVPGSVNAVEAITYSACFYVFRCLLAEEAPATAGLMRPIRVMAPPGTLVNARPPAAVAGGNVETSQRIVDVLLRALAQAVPQKIPAAANGTMNNLTLGGVDPRNREPFAYYETVAGGMGARPTSDGVSAIHCHMTNSLNTPAEALEYAYPFRVTQYAIRRGSGGTEAKPGRGVAKSRRGGGAKKRAGFRGGDGIIREIEVLTESEVNILADRRKFGPYGLHGGAEGKPGKTEIIRRDGRRELLPGKCGARLQAGDRVRIESPGGGGFGPVRS